MEEVAFEEDNPELPIIKNRDIIGNVCRTGKPIGIPELAVADEVLLTGTHSELASITSINKKKIADGVAGRITRKLYAEFNKMARSGNEGTPNYETEKIRA